jgi:hypothetical protein
MPGNGCEYGLDWAIAAILREELTPVDTEEAFEESVRSCYPEEVQVGWMSFDVVTVMKEMDPISWDLAMSEWLDQEVEEENIILISGEYYNLSDAMALVI